MTIRASLPLQKDVTYFLSKGEQGIQEGEDLSGGQIGLSLPWKRAAQRTLLAGGSVPLFSEAPVAPSGLNLMG